MAILTPRTFHMPSPAIDVLLPLGVAPGQRSRDERFLLVLAPLLSVFGLVALILAVVGIGIDRPRGARDVAGLDHHPRAAHLPRSS